MAERSAKQLLEDWIQELETSLVPATGVRTGKPFAQGGEMKKKTKDKKQQGRGGQPAPSLGASDEPIAKLDIRIGRIVEAWEHPDSEKLFCEKIDFGGGEVRNIASGLRAFYQLKDLHDRMVVVMYNLKARPLGGFKSEGMVLCASNEAHTDVVFLEPPSGAQIGDQVTFPGIDMSPVSPAQVQKKKVLEACIPHLRIGGNGRAEFKGVPFTVEGHGVCTAPVTEGYAVS